MPGEWVKLYGEFPHSHVTKVHCILRRCKGSENFYRPECHASFCGLFSCMLWLENLL